MRDSEPKRAYNAVGCVRYGVHVIKIRGVQGGRMRDSEPKRACNADECHRHDAHVMKNFCEQKFFGGSSYSENEKQKRMISVGYHPLLFGVP